MDFRIILGQVPESEHMPIGKVYRPGKTIAVIQPHIETPLLIRSLRKAITFPEWTQWVNSFGDPELDPKLAWEDPEAYLPEKYWKIPVTWDNIPPALRV